jgi:hypothetical protein
MEENEQTKQKITPAEFLVTIVIILYFSRACGLLLAENYDII